MDGEIETFINKVDAVKAAIQAMKDGDIDPAHVHVDGVPTLEEERKMEEDKRRRKLNLARREREACARKKREEHEKWWRGAEALYGERKRLSASKALRTSQAFNGEEAETMIKDPTNAANSVSRPLNQEMRLRLKDRYSVEYSRWEAWAPNDPATLSEVVEKEQEEEGKKSKEFEDNNPAFCKQMMDDMKTRAETSEKKESEATVARLKGNRCYRRKRWEKALDLYLESLRARPYVVITLANIAQTLLKLERWVEAIEFCDRALQVDGDCVKALSRRASAFVELAGKLPPFRMEAYSDTGSPSVSSHQSRSNGKVTGMELHGDEVSNQSGDNDLRENDEGCVKGEVDSSKDEGRSHVSVEYEFHDLRGGRTGLLALALEDLDKAVEVDRSVSEDLRQRRDGLRTQIEEENVEARVMEKARGTAAGCTPNEKVFPKVAGPTIDSKSNVRGNSKSLHKKTTYKRCGSSSVSMASHCDSGAFDSVSADEHRRRGGSSSNGEDELQTMGRFLENVLGDDGVLRQEQIETAEGREGFRDSSDTTSRYQALRSLADLLEKSSIARVYLRASGGLLRLAKATMAECTIFAERRNHLSTPDINSRGVDYQAQEVAGSIHTDDGAQSSRLDDPEGIRLMLGVIAAALEGGERLAQQDILRSGLLAEPCIRTLWMEMDTVAASGQGKTNSVVKNECLAGAATHVVRRAVDDLDVRVQVSRSAPLLAGLVSLIGAASTSTAAPLDAGAAASTLARVLLGRTASTASKTLREITLPLPATAGANDERTTTLTRSPGLTLVASKALLAWKEGRDCMEAAPSSVGAALCSVLGNLSLEESFRESFADAFDDGEDISITPAAVLVRVARDTKKDRSEARVLALSALTNACLRTARVQSATLSSGGLELSVAVLSLEGDQRKRHVTPVIAERSSRLLARLSAYPPAVEAMVKPEIVERIMKATARSAALGGNIYGGTDCSNSETGDADASKALLDVGERQRLVHTLAVILRSFPGAAPAGSSSNKLKPSIQSSNVQKAGLGNEGEKNAVTTLAERLNLANVLVSFLPPARVEGATGVTIGSVALRPAWRAPPELAANVCGCLLHILSGEGWERFAQQVINAEGVSRLISLFANSGGGGSAETITRKNAAICLAKLARNAKYKEAIAELRGMEMLLHAGPGLAI